MSCRTPLTFMLTSSLKAAFCNSKARLESAILVSARNLTSIISFLHSASCGEETVSGAPGCAAGAEEAALGSPARPWTHPNASVSLGLCHPDVRVPPDGRGLSLSQGAQVIHFVIDILERARGVTATANEPLCPAPSPLKLRAAARAVQAGSEGALSACCQTHQAWQGRTGSSTPSLGSPEARLPASSFHKPRFQRQLFTRPPGNLPEGWGGLSAGAFQPAAAEEPGAGSATALLGTAQRRARQLSVP